MIDLASRRVQKKHDRSYFLSLLAPLAPRWAGRRAADRFATPAPRREVATSVAAGLTAHRFDVDGPRHRIATWDFGRGGPTVLLVHGWNGQAAQMSQFVRPLVERGCFVVAFDQPAHGQSSGDRATLVDLADAVLAVARKVAPVHAVIGHSLGATAAALAMARGLAVERAVLFAPPAEVPPFARAFARSLGLDGAAADAMLDELARRVGDLGALDLRRHAPRMTAPLLLLHDPDDREVPFAHGASVARAWPRSQLVPLPGLGHHRVLRDPTVIACAADFAAAAPRDQRARRSNRIVGSPW